MMGKKPRSKQATQSLRERLEQAVSLSDPGEFLGSLPVLVGWRGDADYRSMVEIGRMLCVVAELNSTIESEGILHYFSYCGNRWRDAVEYLGRLGAEAHADLLGDAVKAFPGVDLLSEAERLDAIDAMGDDHGIETRERAWESKWLSEIASLADAVRHYMTTHIDELESFLADRDRRLSAIPMNPSDEEILARAYDTGSFLGIEHALVSVEKLSVLMRIAGDPRCEARHAAIDYLYVIAGNLGPTILADQGSDRLAELRRAVESSMSSSIPELNEWAQAVKRFLAAPDPMVALLWMGRFHPGKE